MLAASAYESALSSWLHSLSFMVSSGGVAGRAADELFPSGDGVARGAKRGGAEEYDGVEAESRHASEAIVRDAEPRSIAAARRFESGGDGESGARRFRGHQ